MFPSEIETNIGQRVEFLCASESLPVWTFEGHALPKYAFSAQIGITNQYKLVIFAKYSSYSGLYWCRATVKNHTAFGSSLLLLEGKI